jgi:DNA-3-methyladenine glycosylase I
MSSDVIIGHDGKPRCAWAGAGDSALGRYHDEVWGTRTYDESAMFEALTLGVFEIGLSWSIVFGKRDALRKAFQGFRVARVAAMTERDVDQLVQDASIIRNRGKIQATVDNARAMISASPSLAVLAKSYEITRGEAPRSVADLPKSTPQAEALAHQLKSQGYRFVGPTSVYGVHAERWRGQRPRPWVLPRDRLRHHGPKPPKIGLPAAQPRHPQTRRPEAAGTEARGVTSGGWCLGALASAYASSDSERDRDRLHRLGGPRTGRGVQPRVLDGPYDV